MDKNKKIKNKKVKEKTSDKKSSWRIVFYHISFKFTRLNGKARKTLYYLF